jgi:hypothetical protein
MEKVFHCIKSQKWLILALALIVLGSFFAGMFNSAFYSVKVTRISFDAEHGTLTGLLYMPRGAGPNDPRPAIVTTHGYLNTKEMQDLTAIEMSRRGYIVLALDMYDHGNSRWAADIPVGGQFGTFWIHAQFNAVQYMYAQPFTAKDANGNGLIAVTGHSMGGFSSVLAMFFDEMHSLQSGFRMIAAGLPVGADLSFAASVAPVPQLLAAFGSRPVGFVAGLYDEFFFNEPAANAAAGGTVQRSYWPATGVGKLFLGLDAAGPDGRASQWYNAASGALMMGENVVRASQTGRRIIYAPNEIHPWNHFSATSVNHKIDFFSQALQSPGPQLPASNQIWQWKVFFNFITLVGFFLLIVPVISLLLKLPFLKYAVTAKAEPVPMGDKLCQKVIFWVSIAVAALLPAFLIPTLMERRADNLTTLGNIFLIMGAAAFIFGIVSFIKYRALGENENSPVAEKLKTWGFGGSVFALLCLILYLVAANRITLFALSAFFVAPTTNVILYWALVSAGISTLIVLGFYTLSRRALGARPVNYGVTAGANAVVASLLTAVCGIAAMYILLFITQAIFGVDARIWTLAIRTFTFEHLLVALRYIPFFFLFYYINTIAINANTNGRKLGCLIAVALNSGGLLLWVLIQYALLFANGVAWYPSMSLNTILLFALIPCLGIAAIFARKLYAKTNNVYLAAFTNTILVTMITLANTAVFWNLR